MRSRQSRIEWNMYHRSVMSRQLAGGEATFQVSIMSTRKRRGGPDRIIIKRNDVLAASYNARPANRQNVDNLSH